MRAPVVLSFLAAASIHGLLLFAVRWETSARAFDARDGPLMSVDLVAGDGGESQAAAVQDPAGAAQPPPAPEPTPEPLPTPPSALAASTPEPAPSPAPPPAPEPRSMSRAFPKATGKPKPKGSPSTVARGLNQGQNGVAQGGSGTGAGTVLGVRYRSNPRPIYPPEARRNRQEGEVLLNVEVSAEGRPTDVSLKRTSGYPLLDQAAIEVVRQRWAFEPATAAGSRMTAHVEVPIRFQLH